MKNDQIAFELYNIKLSEKFRCKPDVTGTDIELLHHNLIPIV